ncbi:MAG: hypothetical protein ACD_63C00170G0001 [uncultured bacterium]|nr:MAG: hypothetical protein ACD_63C00170G0001 [uncultured bacterium]
MLKKSEIRSILLSHSLAPIRGLGQNFLIDERVIEKLVRASNIKRGDFIVEVGPGLGVLTDAVLRRTSNVFAVEIDRGFVEFLKERFGDQKLKIVHRDVLNLDIAGLALKNYGYKVVSNLPFNIATAVIIFFLKNKISPSEIIVVLQKEVAERIVEKEGKSSVLSLTVRIFGEPQKLFDINPGSFYPRPKVVCSVLKIKTKIKRDLNDLGIEKFLEAIRLGFRFKRKLLLRNLGRDEEFDLFELKKAFINSGIDSSARPEEVSFAKWIRLVKSL